MGCANIRGSSPKTSYKIPSKFHDEDLISTFENDVFSLIKSRNPLDLKQFSIQFKKKLERVKLLIISIYKNKQGLLTAHNTWKVNNLLAKCKAKKEYFRYLNSLNSLFFLHNLKLELINKDLTNDSRKENEIFDKFMEKIKGCYCFQGLKELEYVIKNGKSRTSMNVLVFQQTIAERSELEKQLCKIFDVDKLKVFPLGLEKVRGRLLDKVLHVQPF